MATLKEQLEIDSVISPYSSQLEVVVDKFAIEFGDWIGNYFLDLHQGRRQRIVFQTAEEALKQFKLENGY